MFGNPSSITDNQFRSIQAGLGNKQVQAWSLDEKKLHINILELMAATLAIKTFTMTQKDGNTTPDGQHGCLVVLVENGGSEERTVGHYQQGDLRLPTAMQDHDYCRVYSKCNEYRSRQGIKPNQGFQRVEIMPRNIQESMPSQGDPRDTICLPQGCHTSSHIMSWKPNLFSKGTGCLSNQVGEQVILGLPTVCTNRECLEEITIRSRDNDSDNTSMATLVMVSPVAATLKKEPNPSPCQRRSTKDAQTTSLDCLREHVHGRRISKKATKLITNSH